jgi:hypothetical protein
VELFHQGKRIASHVRSFKKYGYSTEPSHRPASHRAHLEWTPSRLIHWGQSIGANTAALIEYVIRSKPHPEQGYRSALGILRMAKKFSPSRLEQACEKALAIQAPSYKTIKTLLEQRMEAAPLRSGEAGAEDAAAHLGAAMVCYLFIGSWTFSSVFSYLGGHEVIEHWVLAANLSPTGFLIVAQVIIFLLGWPLEWTEIIIIFVPIFLPLLKSFQIDPIIFGILVALNIQTSFNTPPMAMAAYYLKGVAPPHVKLTEIFGGSLPFVFMVFLTMVLIYIFPQIALWLPDRLYSN